VNGEVLENPVTGEIACEYFHPGKEQQVTVPSGEMHLRINGAPPDGRLHEFFSVLFGLARDGKTDSQGRPPLFLAAAVFSEFKGSIRQAPFGTRVLLALLAPIASLVGHRRQLDQYLSRGPTRR
jgi:hypothetical protein